MSERVHPAGSPPPSLPPLKCELTVALMERELPPAHWMVDDPTNDEDLLADMAHLPAARRGQMTDLYQLVRQAGKPNPSDSLEELLRAANPEFWTTARIWETVGDLRDVDWARLEYKGSDPYYRFGGIPGGAWRLWSLWRNRRRVPVGELGENAVRIELNLS